jgi:hypothetical protein
MTQNDASSPFTITILHFPRDVIVMLRFKIKNVVQTLSYARYKRIAFVTADLFVYNL